MPDLSRLALNQITTYRWTMDQAIEGCAARGVGGIGVWRQYLEAYGVGQTARHLKEAGLFTASLCTSAWFNHAGDAEFKAAIDENRRILDDAAAIGAPTLVMVVGGLPPGAKDLAGQRARVRDALHELLDHARATGVRLGLEPLHPMYAGSRSCLNTMAMANDLCDELGEGTAVVADVYHCWWDPEFEAGLRRAGPDRVATFHLCDWREPTRNLCDRAMVGDGVADIGALRRVLDDIGYKGPFELELFSELDWWRRDPDDVLDIGIERCAPYVMR